MNIIHESQVGVAFFRPMTDELFLSPRINLKQVDLVKIKPNKLISVIF